MVHKTAQAGFTHHAMAGDDNGYRVCAAGLAYGLRGGFQFRCNIPVSPCCPARDGEHGLPDFLLVRRSDCIERHTEFRVRIFKVMQQLFAHCFGKCAVRGLRADSRWQPINAK